MLFRSAHHVLTAVNNFSNLNLQPVAHQGFDNKTPLRHLLSECVYLFCRIIQDLLATVAFRVWPRLANGLREISFGLKILG